MTQQELVSIVSEKIQASVESTTDLMIIILSILSEELIENGEVFIDDFGVLKTQKRSEYVSLNSKTGERLLMPPAIEIVFESYLNVSAKTDTAYTDANNDNIEKINYTSKVLLFEPDLLLKNSVNSAFVNFEPTVLNEGVELSGLKIISDIQEVSETSTLEDYTNHVDKLSFITSGDSEVIQVSEEANSSEIPHTLEEPISTDILLTSDVPHTSNFPVDHGPTYESKTEIVIPEHITSQVNVKTHHTNDAAPPIKQHSSNSRIWMPIMGGVAITLAALFFFNGTTQKKCK